jgi:hypothetical protein
MAGAVVAGHAGPFLRFHRGCGIALVVAGPLIVVATLLNPSRETAGTNCIIRARSSRMAQCSTIFPSASLRCAPSQDTLWRGEARNDSLTGAFTYGSDDHLCVIGNQVGPPLIRHSGEVLSW